jgi:Fe-S-cluster containining protein
LIVNIWPEHGDDAESFETYTVTKAGGKPEIFLKKTAAGACVYLGPAGCTIYERRPVVCRDFDCRRWPNAWRPDYLERPTSRALIVAGLEQQRRSRQALAARFNAALRL